MNNTQRIEEALYAIGFYAVMTFNFLMIFSNWSGT